LNAIGFFLGATVFELAVKLKKPLRQAAVFSTGQALSLFDSIKSSAYGVKEEIEDIIAEAQYENMKKYSKEETDNIVE
jgi:hypothetical protein